MRLSEWVKKSKKLLNKYETFEDLEDDCRELFGRNFQIIKRPDNLILISPLLIEIDEEIHTSRDLPIFLKRDGKYIKLNTKKLIDEVVKVLKSKVTIEKLLEDALCSLSPEELQEVYERVIKKKGKVREEEGCYKLLIGGKKGYPFELMLRG